MIEIETGENELLEYAGACITGACRTVNEDRFAVFGERNVFVVVDGCGGVAAGANAAQLTVECFARQLAGQTVEPTGLSSADSLAAAVLAANAEVSRNALSKPELTGQGATLSALAVERGWCRLVHVGDCRVGRLRQDGFRWLTEDHSLAASMRKSGAEPAAIEEMVRTHPTVLTRYIGPGFGLAVDLSYHPSEPNDLLLLCSDGLWRQVEHAQLERLLIARQPRLNELCESLLAATEAAGGRDNATVVLVRLRR